jgi:hypothetical protein
MTTMMTASLRMASLYMRIRMGRGEGVKEHNCKNGDRRAVSYFIIEAVKRVESDTTLIAMCKVASLAHTNICLRVRHLQVKKAKAEGQLAAKKRDRARQAGSRSSTMFNTSRTT